MVCTCLWNVHAIGHTLYATPLPPYRYLYSQITLSNDVLLLWTDHLARHSTASFRTDRSGSSSALPNSRITLLF